MWGVLVTLPNSLWYLSCYLKLMRPQNNPFGGFSSLCSSGEGVKGDKGRVSLLVRSLKVHTAGELKTPKLKGEVRAEKLPEWRNGRRAGFKILCP
jgi:hypothetical protein